MSSTNELNKYITTLLNSANWGMENLKYNSCSSENIPHYSISVIINSWSALEGFVNLIFLISKPAPKLFAHEIALLEEKELVLNDNGEFQFKKCYQPTAKKILFILNRFSNFKASKFKQTRLWDKIKTAEEYRNILIHPKEEINTDCFSIKRALFVNEVTIEAIKFLNQKTLKISKLPYPI